jgi:hypothetical protein
MSDKQYLETQILPFFFRHQIYVKMFHFQTSKYGAHKASDGYLEKFAANMDRFVEVMQGIVGQVNNDSMVLQPFTFNEYRSSKQMVDKLNLFVKSLESLKLDKQTGLINIRDEMIADAQQFIYLLNFE